MLNLGNLEVYPVPDNFDLPRDFMFMEDLWTDSRYRKRVVRLG